MNIDNLKKLKSWLDSGAPHVAFSMKFSVENVEDMLMDYLEEIGEVEINKPGVGECGTVCCIAGAAILMSKEAIDKDKVDHDKIKETSGRWLDVRESALEWLGMSYLHAGEEGNYFGHPLFNPDCAPENCTPQQAAQAVQNIIDRGDRMNPWVGIKMETSGEQST